MKRMTVVVLSVVLALTLAMPMALGQVGQGAKASGKAAELAEDWWQWAFSKPVATNPLVGDYTNGPECDGKPLLLSDAPGKKWFLGGSITEEPVMRTCTMPVGTQLFFPLVNAAFLPFPDETEEDLQNQANAYLDEQLANSDWEITVDGKELKPNRLVRAVTPFFTVNVPEDGLFGLAPGEYQLVAGGLWVTLPPLPPGEHTIHFEITGGSFDQDVTYHLKVVNRKSAP